MAALQRSKHLNRRHEACALPGARRVPIRKIVEGCKPDEKPSVKSDLAIREGIVGQANCEAVMFVPKARTETRTAQGGWPNNLQPSLFLSSDEGKDTDV
jgi:hypothetical protein